MKTSVIPVNKFDDESAPWDIVVHSSSRWSSLHLDELWAYHELLYFLIWRNLKLRYKQTILGAAWAVIQPFFAMVVFSIFFGGLAHIPSEGVPYPVFSYAALVPWTFFANALTQGSNSLIEQEQTITKVYFPRLLLPMAAVLSNLLDFAIAFVILIGMMLWYGLVPTAAVWTLPIFILMATLTALGVSIWLSALNVRFRDIRYVTAFLIQVWLFATPVAYPSSLLPEKWRALYGLNPMAGVVEGFRWALLGNVHVSFALLSISFVVVIGVLAGGLYYFHSVEDTFADVV